MELKNEITPRKARLDELDILLQFEQNIITAERPFDNQLKEKTNYYDIAKLIESPKAEVLVVEIDGEIIASGYVKIKKSEQWHIHEQHAYLGFMYVKPEHRRKGMINLILNGLKKWCKEQGIHHLFLEVYVENIGAVKAYEKAGFKKCMTDMRMFIE